MQQPATRTSKTVTKTTLPGQDPVIAEGVTGGMTGEDVAALRIRINDLKRELQDAAERRSSIARNLRGMDESARPGYLERLQVLDGRIIAIERELTSAVQQLADAPPSALVEGTSREPDPNLIITRVMDDIVPLVALLSVFVLAPIMLGITRWIWRRGSSRPKTVQQADEGTHRRLDQLQQAVDTIAIEVERISEGQRFVTKLLSERDRALGAGPAEPIMVSRKATVPGER